MPAKEIQLVRERLKNLTKRIENQTCIDCSAPRPTWASLISIPKGVMGGPIRSLGVFCCFHCAGIHRILGADICVVRSISLDSCTLDASVLKFLQHYIF